MILFRSILFTAVFYVCSAIGAIMMVPLLLAPSSWMIGAFRGWAKSVIWALDVFCAVKLEVRGREHMPKGAGFVAAKHFAMLDTIAPLETLPDPAYVLKRELMRLPFWGWYTAKLDMLPIDREGGSKTLRAMVTGARERMADGRRRVILISCLGLFGLATFSAEQRNKEIGVRKVLGASVPGIVKLLSTDFLKLVFIAFLIATPISWWAMQQWLQRFAYRVPVSWWMFALAGLLAVFIALFTISFQAIRAAVANPVKSLRSE